MKTRTNLTKSLHTVTVIVNTACYLALSQVDGAQSLTAEELVSRTLGILGQACEWPDDDATVLAALRQIRKLGVAR